MGQVMEYRPRSSKANPADGEPVLDDLFARARDDGPTAGWSLERWQIAPGDGEPAHALRACAALQEHLLAALPLDDLQACFRTPITAHYYTQWSEQSHGQAWFEGLVYSPILGWIVIEPTPPHGTPGAWTVAAWSGQSLRNLLADQGGPRPLPELTRHLQPATRTSGYLSDLLRQELASLPGR